MLGGLRWRLLSLGRGRLQSSGFALIYTWSLHTSPLPLVRLKTSAAICRRSSFVHTEIVRVVTPMYFAASSVLRLGSLASLVITTRRLMSRNVNCRPKTVCAHWYTPRYNPAWPCWTPNSFEMFRTERNNQLSGAASGPNNCGWCSIARTAHSLTTGSRYMVAPVDETHLASEC